MRRVLCLILMVIGSYLSVIAQPVAQNHGRHFATYNRRVVVHASTVEDRDAIEQMMVLHGAKIMTGFVAELIYPHISFKQVHTVQGSNSALSIRVSSSSIKISYTSQEMGKKAMEYFRSLFEAPYGQRIIHGRNIVEIMPTQPKSTLKRNSAGVVDGVTRTLTAYEVQAAMKRSAPGDFMMAIVSRRIFRFDFDVFASVNPTLGHIAQSGGYTSAQIVEMVKYGLAHRLNFVPAIDLLSDNAPFKTYTGHQMNSVEGMRFVRAMLEQCAQQWGVSKICIGNKEDIRDKRYMEFLYNIAGVVGLELVMI